MSSMRPFRKFIVPAVAFGLGAAVIVTAGPLDPPSGAIAPTYKTLSDVEPRIAINAANTPGDADSTFRISQSGSYYLTASVPGLAGKSTIEIAANNVSIDLNGFTLLGAAGTKNGIAAASTQHAVVIRNGVIRNHAESGIYLGSSTAVVVQDVICTSNGLDGIWPGASATVERVKATLNGRNGFDLSSTSSSHFIDCDASGNFAAGFGGVGIGQNVLERCMATSNAGVGIELHQGCIATDCISAKNGTSGFRVQGDRVTLERCSAESNTGAGFALLGSDHVIRSCQARFNGHGPTKASGFVSLSGSANHTYSDCRAIQSGRAGFESVATRTDYIRCVANDNLDDGIDASVTVVRVRETRAESNGQHGLDLGASSVVEQSLVRSNIAGGLRINGNGNAVVRQSQFQGNFGIGLAVGNGSVIEDCLVASNSLSGCTLGSLSVVRRSTFDANGVSAATTGHIHCTGSVNLIEDNFIYNGDPGIVVTVGGGTIVRRNVVNATANNYGLIVGGNRVATINTSATLSSTNPNDNFSY
jgi:hypothetical protein